MNKTQYTENRPLAGIFTNEDLSTFHQWYSHIKQSSPSFIVKRDEELMEKLFKLQTNKEKPHRHKYSACDFSRLSQNGSNEHGLECSIFLNEFNRIVGRIEHTTPQAMAGELNRLLDIAKYQGDWVDTNKPYLPLASVVGEWKFDGLLYQLNDTPKALSLAYGAEFKTPWGRVKADFDKILEHHANMPKDECNKRIFGDAIRAINLHNDDVPF